MSRTSSAALLILLFVALATAISDWQQCERSSLPGEDFLPEDEDFDTECGTLRVPLSWETRDGPRIDLFVKRYAKTDKPKGILVVVADGPGASHASLERQAIPLLLEKLPDDINLYAMDHRGTGDSAPLVCPDGSSIPECNSFLAVEYGQDLKHYTLTNAARDLEYLFTDIRHDEEEAELYVYAVGYGAVLLNRFLILRDDLLDAVIIDSPGPTEPFFYQTQDQDMMEVATRFMGGCDRSEFCNAQAGGEPMDRLQDVFEGVNYNSCIAGYTKVNLQRLFAQMLADKKLRLLINPLVKRIRRCNGDDQRAIASLNAKLAEMKTDLSGEFHGKDTDVFSYTAQRQFLLTELYSPFRPAPNAAIMSEVAAPLYFATYLPTTLGARWATWPGLYTPDKYFRQYPDEFAKQFLDTPMIILSGTLDPTANPKFAQNLAGFYNKKFISFDGAPHPTLGNTPVNGKTDCAMQVIKAFLNNATHHLTGEDLQCRKELVPVDFDCLSRDCKSVSLKYFSTSNAWGGAPEDYVDDDDNDYGYVVTDPFSRPNETIVSIYTTRYLAVETSGASTLVFSISSLVAMIVLFFTL